MRKELMDLQSIKDQFFDPELMKLISEYLIGKQFMILPVTLGGMIGASAGRLVSSEEELDNFMKTIAAIITTAAEHSFEAKMGGPGPGEVKH